MSEYWRPEPPPGFLVRWRIRREQLRRRHRMLVIVAALGLGLVLGFLAGAAAVLPALHGCLP